MVKIHLDATFLWHFNDRVVFCVNDYIAKMYTKIVCNISSGRFDVDFQIIQPILKFPFLISLINNPQIRHLKQENHLKLCHLWLTLKWITQNAAFHRCLRSDALFGH